MSRDREGCGVLYNTGIMSRDRERMGILRKDRHHVPGTGKIRGYCTIQVLCPGTGMVREYCIP